MEAIGRRTFLAAADYFWFQVRDAFTVDRSSLDVVDFFSSAIEALAEKRGA
jgi:hypothetical protein